MQRTVTRAVLLIAAISIRAATEIAAQISALPLYRQALSESFAEIVERHTRSQEMLAACVLARTALRALNAPIDVVEDQRRRALAALEKVMIGVL